MFVYDFRCTVSLFPDILIQVYRNIFAKYEIKTLHMNIIDIIKLKALIFF